MSDLIARIAAAYDAEQRDPVERTVDPAQLPRSYETISPEWLTAILCAEHPGWAVLGYRLGPADNASSNRRKIQLEYTAAELPTGLHRSLFCKATHDLNSRILTARLGSAECEINFYKRVRPHLPIEAPQCVFARLDPHSFNSMIMLIDLGEAVSEFCSHTTEITRERIESQLTLFATVHGACASDRQLRSRLPLFQTWREFFGKFVELGLKQGAERGFLAAEHVIPTRLFKRFAAVWPAVAASVECHESLPRTLIHGDAHARNWYIAKDGRMGLCDWQNVTRGHWSRDFAHVMSALTIENRRAWEHELLGFYIDRMQQAGGPRTTLDDAWLRYRQQLMSVLMWWTITSTGARPTEENILLEFVRRAATAVDDLDSLHSF